MKASANTKMINGRVNQRAAEKATRILADEELTVSSFIRNSIEYIARTGTVPESGRSAKTISPDHIKLRELVTKLEAIPMPGKLDYPNLDEQQLTEQLLMERYGY